MSVIVTNSESEGTSNTTFPSFVAQYEGNRENQVTEIAKDDYEKDQYDEELYEEKYWEQCELAKKENGFKKKSVSECKETDDNFITYRKTNSKDQKERQMNKGYKLDRTTTLLIEKLIDVRNFDPYHDAIGENRNSIVIIAGMTHFNFSPNYTRSYKNAIKIYKLNSDYTKNKAIFQRTKREFDNMHSIKSVCWCKNIIVMVHFETDENPAIPITMVFPDLCYELYYQVIRHMWYMYKFGGIIHGNLNDRNILFMIGWAHSYMLGWAHSLRSDHRDALKKLMRDCYFVTQLFRSKGVPVEPTEKLFKEISKLQNISKEVLDVTDRNKKRSKRANHSHRSGGHSRFK